VNDGSGEPPGEPVEPVIVEETLPDPLAYYMAQQIQELRGPRETCMADWLDSAFGTEEHRTIDVPTRGLEEHSESYSQRELATFRTGRLSPSFIRRVKAGQHEPIPNGILVRAMYLALEQYHATPTDQIVLTCDANAIQGSHTLPHDGAKALRVQVRRDVEWGRRRNIRAGTITVRRIHSLDDDHAGPLTHSPRV